MIKIDFFSQSGEKQEQLSFNVAERYLKTNTKLISQVLYIEENNTSRKSGFAKTKGEVRGGGRKPWKQKGTGRARAGSNRSPLFRGGGVTFGPRAVSRILSLPKTMKQLAFGQAIVEKAKNGGVIAIESLESKNQKTKTAAETLNKLVPGREAVIVFAAKEREKFLPWRNIALAECTNLSDLNVRDMMNKKTIILSKEGAGEIFAKLK